RRDEQDVRVLAERLRTTGIKDLYVHSGPFEHDGRLDPAKYPEAPQFVQWAKLHMPGVRVSAWLGQRVKDGLDLDDPAARQNVLGGVADVMKAGFDGVHYNFEPLGDGDTDFLVLLEETRRHASLVSTSVPQIEPYPLMRVPSRAVLGHAKYWSRGYFQEVASRVDQVAIVPYDTRVAPPSVSSGWRGRGGTRPWCPRRCRRSSRTRSCASPPGPCSGTTSTGRAVTSRRSCPGSTKSRS